MAPGYIESSASLSPGEEHGAMMNLVLVHYLPGVTNQLFLVFGQLRFFHGACLGVSTFQGPLRWQCLYEAGLKRVQEGQHGEYLP